MSRDSKSSDIADSTEALRTILKSQYHAALAMLRETIERCPDDDWFNKEHTNSFWQIAYHALFFTHLYLQPNEAAFRPWEHHQALVQHPDGIADPPDSKSDLPLIPRPYTKAEVLAYWSVCDEMVDRSVDALDLYSQDSGFSWYKVPKLEHQIINIRHLEHHMAQLADRVRSSASIGIRWVGSRRSKKPTAPR
jgi:hypothetical protein